MLVMIVCCNSLVGCGIGCIFTLDNSVASVFVLILLVFLS